MFHKAFFSKNLNGIARRSVSNYVLTKTDYYNGIRKITMCNTKTRNALSIDMMQSLIDHIKSDQENENIRAIILAAEGPVFSAGHNLKELDDNREKQELCFKLASELMNTILDSPVPVIAKVDGLAAAAGCQLVAQCDIAVCSDKSTFSTPGANFGIFCSTPGVALARCVNKKTALYMLLTGCPITAQQAVETGLVTKSCSQGRLEEEVDTICEAIKSKSRDVIDLGKRFFYKQIQFDVKEAYKLGGDTMVQNLQMPDCKEGIKSFIEKRKPKWGSRKQ